MTCTLIVECPIEITYTYSGEQLIYIYVSSNILLLLIEVSCAWFDSCPLDNLVLAAYTPDSILTRSQDTRSTCART